MSEPTESSIWYQQSGATSQGLRVIRAYTGSAHADGEYIAPDEQVSAPEVWNSQPEPMAS